ncbi:hypothetical protein ABZ501_27275 [Streptomyces sp. NPDC019922]|uniref:hypothetical protein n=1 Tax=Streptomyces TaxID=1883 RepID=UPI001F1CF1AF|nr:hypothetical protein [Streptomyces sp. SID7834]
MRRAASVRQDPYLAQPPWVPPAGGLRTWECGEHFDAIRLPATLAPPLIAALQTAGGRGPVLADPYSGSWHILLDPGTVQSAPWARYGIRLLRPGTRLTVPAAHVTTGTDLHWRIPPGIGETSTELLGDILNDGPHDISPRRGAQRARRSR